MKIYNLGSPRIFPWKKKKKKKKIKCFLVFSPGFPWCFVTGVERFSILEELGVGTLVLTGLLRGGEGTSHGGTLVLTGLFRGGGGGTSHFQNYLGGGGWPLLHPPPPCSYAYVCWINIHSSVPSHNLNPMGRPYTFFACSVENISIVLFPVSVRK